MALNTFKCYYLTPLHLKGLTVVSINDLIVYYRGWQFATIQSTYVQNSQCTRL